MISYINVIFLTTFENQVTTSDAQLSSGETYPFMNLVYLHIFHTIQTYLKEFVPDTSVVSGVSSRWMLPVRFTSKDLSNKWIYYGYIYAINSRMEDKLKIGYNWHYPPLEDDHCYISKQMNQQLEINKNDVIVATVYINNNNF